MANQFDCLTLPDCPQGAPPVYREDNCDTKHLGWSWYGTCNGWDWKVTDGALAQNSLILDAITIQLFSDIRVNDKNGWWGDYYHLDDAGFQIGSKLWTISRRENNETQKRVKRYIKDALKPLVIQGFIGNIDISFAKSCGLNVSIQVECKGSSNLTLNLLRDWDKMDKTQISCEVDCE